MGRKRKKKTKYAKTHMELFKCRECAFEWAYRTVKCPICSANEFLQTI
ncbi:MAG: hypothetical protein ABIG30_01770 [Candidatus Aenigmatarchaeota archaeon]